MIVSYNCPALLESKENKDYFDEVIVSISDGSSSEIMFSYIVVCDPPKLRSFDLNFIALFSLAVIC